MQRLQSDDESCLNRFICSLLIGILYCCERQHTTEVRVCDTNFVSHKNSTEHSAVPDSHGNI